MTQADPSLRREMRRLAVFSAFSPAELDEICTQCERVSLPAGATLIRQGETSDGRVYFLLEGKVSVYVDERYILSLERPGDIIGEMALVREEPRSATVRGDGPTALLALHPAAGGMGGGSEDYRQRYYLTRMFADVMAEKLQVTSDRARLYEDAILDRQRVAAHSVHLERHIERNLRQIRLYSHLVDSARDAILIADAEGRVERANPAFGATFGLGPAALDGRHLRELLGLSAGQWAELRREARGRGWAAEVVVQGGAEPIPADCTVSQVRDTPGDPLALAVILRDIRDRKAYEARILSQQEALERAYHDLQAVDTLKQRIVSRVSHELRTPLAGLMGSLEMLAMPDMVPPEEREEFMAMARREAERLSGLVERLLTLSRIESGQMAFTLAEVPIAELIEQEVAQHQALARAKGLALEFERDGPVAPVTCDAAQIRTVLRHLLDNATKFTGKGGICVRLHQENDTVVLSVTDTGVGIDPARQATLFDTQAPFERAVEADSGAGLGLPLSNLIVTAHSGTLRVRSTPGEGSTFLVRLPLIPAMARESLDPAPNPTPARTHGVR